MKHTEIALNQLASDIQEARQDIKTGFLGSADMILDGIERQIRQIKREQLPDDIQAARDDMRETYQGACAESYRRGYQQRTDKAVQDIDQAMKETRTTIGTFFDDLRAIYEPKQTNLKP